MKLKITVLAATSLLFAHASASAQVAPEAATPAVAAPTTAACCVAPVGTIIDLEIGELLESKTRKRGDRFPIQLALPIKVDGRIIVPAGVRGEGEIVHAARSAIGGKPGELMLAARYLQYGPHRIGLKAMKLGASGRDNSAAVLAAGFVIPLAFFVPGGEVKIPVGAQANAKLSADLVLPPLADTPASEAAPSTTSETKPQEPSS